MSETPRVGAFAIVPSNDLIAAIPFWERLGKWVNGSWDRASAHSCNAMGKHGAERTGQITLAEGLKRPW
jgi:hypothetical protein